MNDNIIDRKEEVDVNKMNYLKKLLSGQKEEDNIADMEMIADASVRLNKAEMIGMIQLMQLNTYFKSEIINSFQYDYLNLRKKTKNAVGDLVKATEVKNNKKLIEKTSIGMKV